MKKSKKIILLDGEEEGNRWNIVCQITDIGKFKSSGTINYRNEKQIAYQKKYNCDNKNLIREYNKQYKKDNPIKRLFLDFCYEEGYGVVLMQDISKEGKIYGVGNFIITMTPDRRKRTDKRRRERNLILLNEHFLGAELHHLSSLYGIYIPRDLHRSVFHDLVTGRNMIAINEKALRYLDLSDNKNKKANCFKKEY